MKILHYLCGLPPVRRGGMIKYAMDLMEAQSLTEEVVLLLPGRISPFKMNRKKVAIRREGSLGRIGIYRIKNPLPVPMANGIKDIEWFTQSCEEEVYHSFLQKVKPDIIHVHTLMGLHLECLQAAKKMGIPILFTTHDYFGICPKTDLICEGRVCIESGVSCDACSRYAFSEKRLVLEQSNLYRFYRNQKVLTKKAQGNLLKGCLTSFRSYNPEQAKALEELQVKETHPAEKDYRTKEAHPAEEKHSGGGEAAFAYRKLLDYYRLAFEQVTFFHFNSQLARDVYERFLGKLPGKVVPISNASVSDRRREKKLDAERIRVGFLGGDAPYKGLHLLRQAMEELYAEGIKNFSLEIYGSTDLKESPFCHYHDAYQPEDLERIMEGIDLLAVPSCWQETFGMVVLEGVSCGVPVLLTEKVGAKDLLMKETKPMGFITEDTISSIKEELKIISLSPSLLSEINRNIVAASISFQYVSHVEEMKNVYLYIISSDGVPHFGEE